MVEIAEKEYAFVKMCQFPIKKSRIWIMHFQTLEFVN